MGNRNPVERTRDLSLLWVNQFAVTLGDSGGTRHLELGRELVRLGWGVTVSSSDFHLLRREYTRRREPSSVGPVAEIAEGVRFRWLWAAPYNGNNWRRGWNWLSFGRSVLQYCETTPAASVVIGSSPQLLAAAAAELAARRWGVPFVLEVRDLWPESLLASGGRRGPFYLLLAALARRLYARADRIICLARGSIEYLERKGVDPEKLVYVPNGVDTTAFEALERPERERFTVVYAGAHGPANGLDVVLDAAERLGAHARIRFLLVGDGPAKAGLVLEAERRGLGNVEFREPIPKLEMPALLREADAGLMVLRETPLFSFGVSPNKLFDYFGASLPVVCNVPGEVAGMVCSAGAGEQAEAGSAASLADAVLRLAGRTQQERLAMGRSAREWVSREHGRTVLAERLDRVLRELLVA